MSGDMAFVMFTFLPFEQTTRRTHSLASWCTIFDFSCEYIEAWFIDIYCSLVNTSNVYEVHASHEQCHSLLTKSIIYTDLSWWTMLRIGNDAQLCLNGFFRMGRYSPSQLFWWWWVGFQDIVQLLSWILECLENRMDSSRQSWTACGQQNLLCSFSSHLSVPYFLLHLVLIVLTRPWAI